MSSSGGAALPQDRNAGRVTAAVKTWLAQHVAPKDPVIVACSGGADSLALALATHLEVRSAAKADSGSSHRRVLVGATVDHRLQPGSAERALATADQLAALGYQRTEVLTVDVSGPGGPEAAARRARYSALLKLAEQVGTSGRPCAVLLAHTADDQAETVLLGLARGSGPRSIAGMRPWRPPWGRPLLGLSRETTEATCRAAGLVPWQDPHNSDPAFTRVRLRREVLPLMEVVLGGGVRAALSRTARLMAEDLEALDGLAAAVLKRVEVADGSIDATALAEHPAAIRARVLRMWANDGGAGPLTFDHLSRMGRQLDRAGLQQVRLPGGFEVIRIGSMLRLDRVGAADRVVPAQWQAQHAPPGRPNHCPNRPGGRAVTTPEPSISTEGWSSLTTHFSSADAIPAATTWDPGAEHGYHGELSAVLIPALALQAKIVELAAAVAADHTFDTPPLLICVLKGAVMFTTDFARALPIPSELEFMAVSSYGSATSSSGVVRILKDLDRDITGRRVIIVEDIIDSGLTLSWLLKNLATRSPAAVDIVALLRKPEAVKVEVDVRYVGFDIPTDFVVGYGLDYNERYRDLPFVGLLGEHMFR